MWDLIISVPDHCLSFYFQVGAISPFSSNVVIIRKKDVTMRFCIDHRKLNQWTVNAAHASSRIYETLHLPEPSIFFNLSFENWILARRIEAG